MTMAHLCECSMIYEYSVVHCCDGLIRWTVRFTEKRCVPEISGPISRRQYFCLFSSNF